MSSYRAAIGVGALGLGSILWALLAPDLPQPFAFAAALLPVAVLLAVKQRIGQKPPLLAAVGGAGIGAVVALLSHGLVLGFAYLFFLGFAEQAVDLLDALRVDPQLTTVLRSSWAIVFFAELVLFAPFTEEAGKAVGAFLSRPTDRRQAFLAGVTAGTGFAIVENLLYAAFLGVPWNAILLARSLGVAVHPLATGLVMLGWWEWRHGQGRSAFSKRLLAGVGVHALWNASLVALTVTEAAFLPGSTSRALTQVSLVYSAAVGAILAAILWQVSRSVAEERERLAHLDLGKASTVGAWTVLAATFLLPMTMLVLAFPAVYGTDTAEAQVVPVEYESVEEIALAMSDAGFDCSSEVGVAEGTVGEVDCEWPADRNPRAEYGPLTGFLFESELARVRFLVGGLIFCGAVPEPLPTVAYVHGSTWAVVPGYCDVPSDDMSYVAEVLRGRVNVTDLRVLYEIADDDRPFENWTTNELKEFLGETITSPDVIERNPEELAPVPLPSIVPVEDTDAPEVGAKARAEGWEVIGWPEIFETNDVIATQEGFIAVGSTGFRAGVWSSADGLGWTSRHFDQDALTEGRIDAVAATPFGYVAIGENDDFEASSWFSADGETWQRYDGLFGDIRVTDLVSGGPGVLAVGQHSDGRVDVLTSGDGRAWLLQSLRLERRAEMAGKLASSDNGAGPVVLIGTDAYRFYRDPGFTGEPTGQFAGLVWSSPDGISWERSDDQLLAELEPTAVSWGNNEFMLIGQRDDFVVSLTSEDGATWREAGIIGVAGDPDTSPPVLWMNGVTWTGSEWLAGGTRMGDEWVAFRSFDGSAWNEVNLPTLPGAITAFASGNSSLVAIGHTETEADRYSRDLEPVALVAHSPDGDEWALIDQTTSDALAETDRFIAVATTDQALYAVGSHGIWTSNDGRTWLDTNAQVPFLEDGVEQLVSWKGSLYALSEEIWASTDGIEWSRTSDPPDALGDAWIHQLIATDSALLAVGQVDETGGIWVTSDGDSWRRSPEDPQFFSVPVMAAAANAQGELVAIGQYGEVVWTSSDGATWTPWEQSEPLFAGFFGSPGILATDSGWVLVGAQTDQVEGIERPAAWISADGREWQSATLEPETITGSMEEVVEYSSGLVASGPGGLWTSPDGRAWESLTVAPVEDPWEIDLVSWNDRIIAVGGAGRPIVWLGPTAAP